MNAQEEISTQEICKLLKMSPSYFAQKRMKHSIDFPQAIRIGGITNTAEIYNRQEFMAWLENWEMEKILKKAAPKKLIHAFLCGKFDRSGLKDVYQLKAIRAKLNKPQTLKIHIEENYDAIKFSDRYWGGMI